EFMGIPATGRQIAITGISIHRFADGEFVESWASYDSLGMMQQITAHSIPEGLVVDQITSPSLEGNLLGDPATREVIVYLPPSYDQGGNFPVVYLLHGYTGNARTFVSDAYTGFYWPAESDFPEGGIYSLLNDLIAAGDLKEMIVVMPDASNLYGGSWYANSELTGNYEDYIVEDLVGYIDSNYRTVPSRDSRAIVGHSMGGHGAMKLAMKHPDVFGAVASHGGALYFEVLKGLMPAVIEENPAGITGPAPDKPMTSVCYSMSAAFSPNLANPPFFVDLPFEYPSPEIIDEVWDRIMEHDVLTMLGTYGTNVSSLRGIYMDVGAQDEFASNFQTDALHQALDAAGIVHECEIYSGTHYDRLFERLTISLKFLSDALGG
ncbi:MAG: alpha/beta fold hydrolase, partial [Planctomycetota bacterium]